MPEKIKRLLKGNEAVVHGALMGGATHFFGYPITPASEIAHAAALYFTKSGRHFLQAESEVSAINMIYGAAAAGSRVMTATSGPGLSLMAEGISYIAGAELPCVLVDVQRAGPGLGNIWPEQSDYNAVVKGGGHGNYKNLVLAPNSAQEMCDMSCLAFELADLYRNTVIILSDAYIGQMMEPVELPDNVLKSERKDWALYGDAESRNNLITSILMDTGLQSEHNWKLQNKYELIAENHCLWEEEGCDDAEILFVAYGITSRICLSALQQLRKKGIKAGLLRPRTLFPFPEKRLSQLSEHCSMIISAELANGQMSEDVERIIAGRSVVKRYLWLGGIIPSVEEICERAEADLKGLKADLKRRSGMIVHEKPKAFYETFERKGPGQKTTHYCPGCGHGTAHKLIAELLVDLGIQDRTVFCSPVGCSVFAYYYMDTGNIQCAHGRAPAVATGLRRVNRDSILISYQGDGDLAAIGTAEIIHAANRGENMTVFFINNAIYGMTGGQMAPTTLEGQKTMTTPLGRSGGRDGHPIGMAEVMAALKTPVFIERVSLSTPAKVMKARKVFRKALQYQIDNKGFSFVEVLSPCPINWKMDPVQARRWIKEVLEPRFPLGNFRDDGDKTTFSDDSLPYLDDGDLVQLLHEGGSIPSIQTERILEQQRVKIAGFGGQGVLSAGVLLANIAIAEGLNASWLPSYGPEMRGGKANTSVIISNDKIGSPVVDRPNVLIALNKPSLISFEKDVTPGGLILVNSSLVEQKVERDDVRVVYVPASAMARDGGVLATANTILLTIYLKINGVADMDVLKRVLPASVKRKDAVELNLKMVKKALEFYEKEIKGVR